MTHPEEFNLAASMIPQEPKLLQTPLAEDGEGNRGVTRKSIKNARSPMRAEMRTSPLPTDDCFGPPRPKVTGLELGSRAMELSR